MKNSIKCLIFFAALICFKPAKAQSNETFQGAEATNAHYKAVYFVDEGDAKKLKMTMRNIDNALEDPRLKGKLEIELVAFADGVELYKKSNPYEAQLLALQKKGVILAQCSNTVRERNIDKSTLFSFIGYVPSGNGEIIIRAGEGWTVVHP